MFYIGRLRLSCELHCHNSCSWSLPLLLILVEGSIKVGRTEYIMDDTNIASDTAVPPETASPYPTRQCRLCREEVVPTVTMSNASLPSAFRSVNVEYKSEDEGRLIKPCKCKGTQRYIHELCLMELRAKSPVKNAYLKCDLCGYQYNTRRLLIHDLLLSRVMRALFTILLVIVLMFMLGFVADPIINLYVDPYETLATQRFWKPVDVTDMADAASESWWAQHFLKGFVSIGVMGFIKSVLLANPWHFWNLRHTGILGGTARTTTTGRERAINISWIAVVIGVGSALYFFYQQIAKFSHSTLSKMATTVIEVQMDDDDEDLAEAVKNESSPAAQDSSSTTHQSESGVSTPSTATLENTTPTFEQTEFTWRPPSVPMPTLKQSRSLLASADAPRNAIKAISASARDHEDGSVQQLNADLQAASYSTAMDEAHEPRWSFKNVEDR